MTKLIYEKVKLAVDASGGDLTAACKLLNAKYITLWSFVKRHSIPFNSKKPPTPPKEQLEEAYARLGALSLVAKELGGTKEGIRQAMHRHGLHVNELVIHTHNDNFFSLDNELSFYWAGFIAADGCVGIHGNGEIINCLGVALARKDRKHLELFGEQIQTTAPVGDYLVKNSERNPEWNDTWKSEIKITSPKICADLVRFDIVPRKSNILTFPEWMKTHPLKHHFIRGYNDGDGSFYIGELKDGRTVEQVYFSMRGTSEFLLAVRDIFEAECDLEERETEIRISSEHGVLEYGGNGVVGKITNYLYKDATIYLLRKYEIAMRSK